MRLKYLSTLKSFIGKEDIIIILLMGNIMNSVPEYFLLEIQLIPCLSYYQNPY